MKRNTATLERLMEPVARIFTPEVAKALVELRADPALQARMDELAEKCNEGQLTPDEREEYETSIRFGNFIAILQAKERRLACFSNGMRARAMFLSEFLARARALMSPQTGIDGAIGL